MSSPLPGFLLLVFYLHFVQTLGPRLMANRPPFKLERIHRRVSIGSCFRDRISSQIVSLQALVLAWLNDYSFACQPVDFSNNPRAIEIASTVWLYFLVKIVDLLDTVFFVLRKKQNQVSFLHLYHHTGMVMGCWGAVKYLPGGHVTLLGLINSFVHVVMYTHYLATSLKLGKPWWKKYITQLQLLQFILIILHFSQLIWVKDCGFPRWPAAVLVPQNLFMIVLFGDFYYKAYIKKPARKTEQNGLFGDTNGKPKIA